MYVEACSVDEHAQAEGLKNWDAHHLQPFIDNKPTIQVAYC